MKFNPGIIRNYDIRGEYGVEFDDEFIVRLGIALVAKYNAKNIVVSHDDRPTGKYIMGVLSRAIASMGCNVIQLGLRSTPFLYFATIRGHGDVGVQITASHLPPSYSGFKICQPDAMVLARETGLASIVELIENQPALKADQPGTITQGDYLEEHSKYLVECSGLAKNEVPLKIQIDALPLIQEELGIMLKMLNISVVTKNPDIRFLFDNDGDRLLVYNNNDEWIRSDMICGLLAVDVAQKSGGEKVDTVFDLRFSRGVYSYLKNFPVVPHPCRIGHTYIKVMMKQYGADFGGEASGHIYFKETNCAESTQLVILKLLKIIVSSGKTLDELVRPMETWSYTYEVNTPINGWPDSVPAIIKKIKERYADTNIDETDGLKIDYEDWWCLIRTSANDPVVRLILEAKTKELMESKIKEVLSIIKEYCTSPQDVFQDKVCGKLRQNQGRLFVIADKDGVLSKPHGKIEPIAEIVDIASAGIPVVIIAGAAIDRSRKETIEPLLNFVGSKTDLLKNVYLIVNNGGGIYRFQNGAYECVFQKRIADEIGARGIEKVLGILEETREKFSEIKNIQAQYPEVEQINNEDVQITLRVLGKMKNDELRKKFDPRGEKRKAWAQFIHSRLMEEQIDLDVTVDGTSSINILLPGVNKGTGIDRLAEMLKVDRREMIYFGDKFFERRNDRIAVENRIELVVNFGDDILEQIPGILMINAEEKGTVGATKYLKLIHQALKTS